MPDGHLGITVGWEGAKGRFWVDFGVPCGSPGDTKSIKFDVFFDMVAQYGRRHHGSYVLRHLGPAAESHMRLKCCK